MNTKHIAAIASLIALVAVSGCASLDVSVTNDDEGNSMPGIGSGQDILQQLHADSQAGGE